MSQKTQKKRKAAEMMSKQKEEPIAKTRKNEVATRKYNLCSLKNWLPFMVML